jgi:hypothetical protein
MTRLLAILCASLLAASPAVRAAPPAVADPALAAGIGLAREGDFQGALLKLDEAIRRLETAAAPDRELAQGYLYLGISYLELGQEMPAIERFRAAVLRDLALRLDPAEFSPQVIRFFEAARQEVAAMRSPAPSAPRPAPTAKPAETPTPPPPAQEKGKSKTTLLVVGGGVALAAAAIALAGSDGEPATTTTRPVGPAPTVPAAGWTSRLDLAGARAVLLFDGAALPPAAAHARARPGRHSLEGRLLAASAGPGQWRFELAGIRRGSLRVMAGNVSSLAPETVVFALEGRAGERVAIVFDLP